MQLNYIFSSFYLHVLCVTTLSCDLGNSLASGKDITEYALLLIVMSLLDVTSQLCKPRKLMELFKAIAMSSPEFCQSDSTKYLNSYHQK